MNVLFPLVSCEHWSRSTPAAYALVMVCGFAASTFAAESDPGRAKSRSLSSESTLAPPQTSRANHVIERLNLELVWIEPGTFTMGSPTNEPGRNKAEGPQTRVTLSKGFWLGKTEVTQRQYEMETGTNPSHFKAAGEDAPVEKVSWLDAMTFCRALTERERLAGRLPGGYEFTLPTEAQWEYACRAGTTGAFAGNPDALAWYKTNSGDTTHPVASKQPNAGGPV